MRHKTRKVGDRATFRTVNGPATGVLEEDRGPIGVGGRRLYRIAVEDTDNVLELPEEELVWEPAA
jgi:hypothetical protein